MGVAMWLWAGLYAAQLPKILLFAVAAALCNEFPKFFRVVIGHAKTDIWLQQLFWLRPFFDPSGPKNPFFLPIFRRGLLNFALDGFSIFCQNLVGLDLVFAQSQKSAYMNAYF